MMEEFKNFLFIMSMRTAAADKQYQKMTHTLEEIKQLERKEFEKLKQNNDELKQETDIIKEKLVISNKKMDRIKNKIETNQFLLEKSSKIFIFLFLKVNLNKFFWVTYSLQIKIF